MRRAYFLRRKAGPLAPRHRREGEGGKGEGFVYMRLNRSDAESAKKRAGQALWLSVTSALCVVNACPQIRTCGHWRRSLAPNQNAPKASLEWRNFYGTISLAGLCRQGRACRFDWQWCRACRTILLNLLHPVVILPLWSSRLGATRADRRALRPRCVSPAFQSVNERRR